MSRHRELTWLTSRLAGTVAGSGQLAFVTGEAGSGKTTLLRELALRGQETYPELLTAISVCNAQTGFGDPYLPFSQLLTALIGNLDASRAFRIEWTDAERFHDARAFFLKHADQAWSFTDCLSFRVMANLHLREALTKDGCGVLRPRA